MGRPTVQIADDHLMFAEPNGRYLALHYDVLPPILKLKAVGPALRKHKPQVLLLDISFGAESSLPLLANLVSTHRKTRFVMVTGHADAGMLAQAMAAGASGYVLKDGGPAELLLAIETVLAGRQYVAAELRDLPAPTRFRLDRPLSKRQRDVLALLREGNTHQEIGDALDISLSTAEKHVLGIRRRLGIEAVTRAIRWHALQIDGLTPPRKRKRSGKKRTPK